MTTHPYVTVIVPVHNVSGHIGKCAKSIFEQTLDSLEILFIDDCSPDNSVEIIQQTLMAYPHRKEQTRIIRLTENVGVAGARKRGILEATGDFVIHCDGDDWVDKELYQAMYNKAIGNNLDIVICGFVYEYIGKSIRHTPTIKHSTGKDIVKNWYKGTIHMSCSNKLVRRSLYSHHDVLPWIGLNMWEDNGLLTRLLYYAQSVGQITGPAYHRARYHYNRYNDNAITAGYGLKQVNQMIAIAENLSLFFKSKPDYTDFEKTLNAFKYLAKLNLITDSFGNLRRFRQIFPESDKIVSELDVNAFSTKGKVRFYFTRYNCAPIFIILFKLKNIFSNWLTR